MDKNQFKQEILNFIRKNDGDCDTNSTIVYSFPLLEKMNESTNLVLVTISDMLTQGLIKINEKGKFQFNAMANITHIENEHHIPVEICKSAPLDEEKIKDESVRHSIDEVRSKKQATDVYVEYKLDTLKEEEKTKVTEEYFVNEEHFQLLQTIQDYFKQHLGVKLTRIQALDRAFSILKNQIEANPASIILPINPSINRPQFNNWSKPGNWNETFNKSWNSFNPPSHFNQMPYPGTPHRAEFVSARELISQDNVKAMRAGLSNRGLDFNTLRREGPYTHVYPDFRNMVLPQREELPMTSKKPVTKRKPKK